MKTNFEIEDNIAIQFKEQYIDIHNNFDFINFSEDLDKVEIRLDFKKSKGDWVKNYEYEYLTFRFLNVSYKYIEDGKSVNFTEDSKCLADMSFFPSNLRDINGSIILQKKPKEFDDLIFSFEDGRVIRICSEKVELEAHNNYI